MIRYIIDTHALLWFLTSDARLGAAAKSVLLNPASVLVLPMIALAEAMFIVEKGKVKIASVGDLMSDVTNDARITIEPLTFDILQTSSRLSAIPEMHDRYIVATGLYLQSLGDAVQILTKDNEIVVSKLIPVVWN